MTLASTIPATSAAPTIEQRGGALAALALLLLRLGPRAELRAARRGWRVGRRLLVGRRVALRASLDQARLQLSQERRVVAQLLGEPLADAVAPRRGAVGEVLQAARRSRSTRRSPLFTSSPVVPRPWRGARAGTRRAARPSSRPRRCPRRDRSRAACEAFPDRCLTVTRPNLGATVTRGTGDAAALEVRAAALDRQRRHPQAHRQPAGARRGTRQGGLPGDPGDGLARHP